MQNNNKLWKYKLYAATVTGAVHTGRKPRGKKQHNIIKPYKILLNIQEKVF